MPPYFYFMEVTMDLYNMLQSGEGITLQRPFSSNGQAPLGPLESRWIIGMRELRPI